jgi:methylase of polypeptide subunit release factors
MSVASGQQAARSPGTGAAAQLGRLMEAAGYTESGVEAAVGPWGGLSLSPTEAVVLRHRLRGRGPLETLIRLFLLGTSVGRTEAARALSPLTVEALGRARLLRQDAGHVVARVRILPMDGLLFIHDAEDAGSLQADHVAGVGPASKTLARLTARRSVDSALDVGAGCGVQALLAARHARRVVAVDVNARALATTRLNARLNGLENVECRQGSFFEPVAGERFGLVVANPPFVVSPDAHLVFSEGDRDRDGVSRAVVAEAASQLVGGGLAFVLCNWVCRPGEEPTDSPRRWVEGSGCDAWILHHRTDNPVGYAAKLNARLHPNDPNVFDQALGRWLDYYRRERIDALANGIVILRRREGRNWVRVDEMPFPPGAEAGAHVLGVFAAQDFMIDLDDGALEHQVFRLIQGHRVEQSLEYRESGYAISDARLRLDEGVGLLGPVLANAIHVLLRLDGRRTLADVIDEAVAETGLDATALRADALTTVRRLFELGFLEPYRQAHPK